MKQQANKKKKEWQNYIVKGLTIVFGVMTGLIISEQPFIKNMSLVDLYIVCGFGTICLFMASFIQILIHEAGHLLFGIISGYSFSSFRIANLMWIKQDERIRLKRLTVLGTGGQCLMNPPAIFHGKMPFFLYNLGGSLLNLVSACVFWGGYVLCENDSFVSMFFLILSIVGFLFAIINGIPLRLGAVDNDGYNIYSMGKSKEALRSFWVQLRMNQELSKGAHIRDLPDDWFYIPSDEGMKNSMTTAMGLLYANRLLDFHNFIETDTYIDHLLSMDTAIVGLHRSLLACDKMYCNIILQDRTFEIEKVLNKKQIQFMKQMKNYPSVIRTQYTIALLVDNNKDKADRYLEQFEKYSKKYPYQGDVESEFELIKLAEQIYSNKNNIFTQG